MMNTLLATILAALATAAGLLGTLMLLTLFMAGGANATPELSRWLSRLMLTTCVGGFACLVTGIILMVKGAPFAGGIVGVLPMLAVFVLLIWTTVKQS